MKWPRFIRLLMAWLFGDDDRRVPVVPDGLPAEIAPIVAANVRLLTDYQDAEYARLYMDRLGRFVRRKGIEVSALSEIARLLATRMAYQDLIWHSQLILARLSGANVTSDAIADEISDPVQPTLREIVAMFPVSLAELMVDALDWPGWADATVTISLTGRTWRGRLAARLISSLRRLRPQSVRYAQERPLVERWLHMIDRALTKQPLAAWEVIETAMLLRGLGGSYKRGLANWHLIINGLAKPTFDGDLPLPDLGPRLAQVRAVAASDPSGEEVRRQIAQIKAEFAHAA